MISSEIAKEIDREATALINKSNVKKYGFPKDKVVKMLTYLWKKSGGTFKLKDSFKFASGYCDRDDANFEEISAIISLMTKYRPREMVTTTLAKGKKVLIVGDVAKELMSNATINWFESHVSSAGAKIPIKLSLRKKMKVFNGESIFDEISRQSHKRTNKGKTK